MPVAADVTLLVWSMEMPWLDARIFPLSMTAPAIVLPEIAMPVAALMVPEFEIFPVKVPTLPTAIPELPAEWRRNW